MKKYIFLIYALFFICFFNAQNSQILKADNLIKEGLSLFKNEDYNKALKKFRKAIKYANDSSRNIAIINSAIAAEESKNYDVAFKYYRMCSNNNYVNDTQIYHSMIRVLNAKNGVTNYKVLKVIHKGKKKYPNYFGLYAEEFNYWLANENKEKGQEALQEAVKVDPNNKVVRFNIGVIFDNMSVSAHKSGNHDIALDFMEKSVESYKMAIELDINYTDSYYNLGALYYNQSIEVKRIAGEMEDQSNYDSEIKRANTMLIDATLCLEKVIELEPKDISTLKVLRNIYFTTDEIDKYNIIKEKLKALGQ